MAKAAELDRLASNLENYEVEGAADGPRVLRGIAGTVIELAHNSVVAGPLGRASYLVYYAWDGNMRERRMCIDPLRWSLAVPACDGPSFQPRVAV